MDYPEKFAGLALAVVAAGVDKSHCCNSKRAESNASVGQCVPSRQVDCRWSC